MAFNKTVVVGMSGGVDSSVTALLLKNAGYNVIGLFMKNWEEKDENGRCSAEKDFEDVVKVCDKLNISYYSVNFIEEYKEKVFKEFLEELSEGHTPNPDILCNKEIKFKVFLKHAMLLGADYLATGHYAQIGEMSGQKTLLKGNDLSKDQTYFLYTLGQQQLSKVLFPIGHLEKPHLREIAKKAGLATATKKDSTGICFIGKRNFKEFVGKYLAYKEGPLQTLDGNVVGKHEGAAYYTIGQRKGLCIGGAGEAWFVVDKDVLKNIVYVAQGENHPSLFCDSLIASDLHFVAGAPPSLPWKGFAKIRYRQEDQPCVIEAIEDSKARVRFLKPQRAITLRQSVVFYEGNTCLGGGKIYSKSPSYYQLKQNLSSILSPIPAANLC